MYDNFGQKNAYLTYIWGNLWFTHVKGGKWWFTPEFYEKKIKVIKVIKVIHKN